MKYGIKMIKIAFAFALFFIFASASSAEAKSVAVNEKNFPDFYFRHYVEIRFDTNRDGVLSDKERKAVTELETGSGSEYRAELEYPAPDTLKGIEHFPNLKKLNCSRNGLSQLDVSKNKKLEELRCYNNSLYELNLKKNKKLKILVCYENDLESLDISGNTELEKLFCSENRLSKLTLSKNKKLTYISVSNNKLKAIDVRKLKKLEKFYCSNNRIKKLDVSQNKKLINLGCGQNKLKKLDLTHNPALDYLDCPNNKLSRLDLRKNNLLQELHCQGNQLLTGNLGVTFSQMATKEYSWETYTPVETSKQKATIKRKKIGKYYYIPLSGLNRTNAITNLSAGIITEKGIRLKKGQTPKIITYEYNMFTDGEELTKVRIRVKK